MYELILKSNISSELKAIVEKCQANERLTANEGLFLYENADLGLLGFLANAKRKSINKNWVYFNRNFHIEPTNICVFDCHFCSYRRAPGQEGAWDYSIEEMLQMVKDYEGKPVSEVHIVGGVHPQRDVHYYGELIQKIKEIRPDIHVKGFTAIEIDYMIKKAGISLKEGMRLLKDYGLQSMPGGGAEIFDEEIRKKICDDKATSSLWLEIHKEAHLAGIPTNATMLYGHLEKYEHRIDHLIRLRELQDETGGFNAFIPLKFRRLNNNLSHIQEVTLTEDLKNFAISRLMLDNIPHLKSYWPMIGLETTRLALSFGVDDLDGTIDDSTKIYTMAGVKGKNSMTSSDLIEIIHQEGFDAVERDTIYNHLQEFPVVQNS